MTELEVKTILGSLGTLRNRIVRGGIHTGSVEVVVFFSELDALDAAIKLLKDVGDQPVLPSVYTVALQTGGLQEDPGWHYEEILGVEANSPDEAKDTWARITGYDQKKEWDPDTRSYWGWSVVILGTGGIR